MNYDLLIKKSFGKTCKYFREKMNLSQEKFALSIGMDRTYYASVELGRRNIALLNITKICSGFNISTYELFSVFQSILSEEKNA